MTMHIKNATGRKHALQVKKVSLKCVALAEAASDTARLAEKR